MSTSILLLIFALNLLVFVVDTIIWAPLHTKANKNQITDSIGLQILIILLFIGIIGGISGGLAGWELVKLEIEITPSWHLSPCTRNCIEIFGLCAGFHCVGDCCRKLAITLLFSNLKKASGKTPPDAPGKSTEIYVENSPRDGASSVKAKDVTASIHAEEDGETKNR